MTSTPQTGGTKRIRRSFFLMADVAVVMVAVYWLGLVFECEYPFLPSLWIAEQTKAPNGQRVTDLIRNRSDDSFIQQHWHHCTFCDDVYPHAPHMAVRVTGDYTKKDFYLFDWDLIHLRLLPISVRTAKAFPELVPQGYIVKPLGVGLNPQLYRKDDEPCVIVPVSSIQ